MEETYELVKLCGRGYVLVKNSKTASEIDVNSPFTIKKLRENANKNVVATTEVLNDKKTDEYYILNVEDCEKIFGVKKTRNPETRKNIKYGSIEEIKATHETMRLLIYNFLSGRSSLDNFKRTYHEYESFLGEHGITDVNGMPSADDDGKWKPDNENDDDEYFNDYLDAEELQKEFTPQDMRIVWEWTQGYYKFDGNLDELIKSLRRPTRKKVTVSTLEDEVGYVVMFPFKD